MKTKVAQFIWTTINDDDWTDDDNETYSYHIENKNKRPKVKNFNNLENVNNKKT